MYGLREQIANCIGPASRGGDPGQGYNNNAGFFAPVSGLPDHLVCLKEEARRDCHAEGYRGLEINDQPELHGPLHGEVAWLGTFENLIHVDSGAPEQREQVRSVAHQPTRRRKLPEHGNRRQAVREGELSDPWEMVTKDRGLQHDKGSRVSPDGGSKRLLELVGTSLRIPRIPAT